MFDCALLLVARLSVLDIILAPFVWNFPEKSLVACVDVGDGVDAPAGVFSSRQDIDTSSGGSVSVESGSSLKTIQRYRALLREAREAAPPRPVVIVYAGRRKSATRDKRRQRSRYAPTVRHPP